MKRQRGIHIFFLILTILWMVMIYRYSARTGSDSTAQSLRAGRLVCSIFVPGYERWTSEDQDMLAEQIDYPIRKGAHATEYAILGILTFLTALSGMACKEQWKPYLIAAAIAILYAASDEFHQLFVPGRSGQVSDVILDAAGVVAGLVLTYRIGILAARRSESKKN